MDNNNFKQKPTLSAITGLTPQQERACVLLASGESVTSVAEQLGVNRCTLYKWQENKAFQCYYNRHCQDYKNEVKNGIINLHQQAIRTIKELLSRGNEATRLKASIWILEKVEAVEVGDADIRQVLQKDCTKAEPSCSDVVFEGLPEFDRKAYLQELKKYGLSENY